MTGATNDQPAPTLGPPPHDLLEGASLFLDFDGTLVDLAQTPDAIAVPAALPGLLRAVGHALDGRLAVVSGRPLTEIAAYLGDGVAASGSHGVETRWRDGRVEAPPSPAWIADAAARGDALAQAHPGLLVERKPHGIALHFRRAPAAAAPAEALARAIAGTDKVLQAGKMVFEVREAGADKGAAVRRFLADPSFAGTRPVFVGDDVTDEDGFRAAAVLGGAGVLVGAPRPTQARYRLESVQQTLAWLGQAARARVPA